MCIGFKNNLIPAFFRPHQKNLELKHKTQGFGISNMILCRKQWETCPIVHCPKGGICRGNSSELWQRYLERKNVYPGKSR